MLNVLSLFSGIGAFEKALSNSGIPYNLLAYCEIDKYASKSYSAIHGVSEDLNLHDVTKVGDSDNLGDVDFVTYGFPCQDISNAGKQRGFTDKNGNRTRSGLFFEALRIIEEFRPKFAIAENVKALTSKKFADEFKTVLNGLEEADYNNYWQVLNAKDYGVPQNRERVFIVSIRKDIDKGFAFPKPVPLELRLKDMLEDEVDEKFYLSDEAVSKIANVPYKNTTCLLKKQAKEFYKETEMTSTLMARDYKGFGNQEFNAVVEVKEATKKGYAEAHPGDSINLEQPNSKTRRGRVGAGVAQTLTTSCNQAVVLNKDETGNGTVRIRRLTPTECYRLQGFTAEDCKKASEVGISNSQLYKQAGNSICVPVLEAIYKSLGEIYVEFAQAAKTK